ncbi:MAG TPA: LptF/LptG family permease [Chlamydiales bacterium]|nr:LptF/LptG family permease [Chlamydiales bacterium]
MPILWRYLLLGYIRIFSLSVCSFVVILLVSRFKEIARFAALSANIPKTWLFVAYQIPLILPFAIPISAFIASLLLFQNMSKSHELTAMRASGVRLSTILFPILFMSLFLSLCNFMICGDIAPFCRRSSKELIYNETSTNPLLLLQRQNLVKMKKSYIKMKMEDDGLNVKDLFLITHNQSNNRLSLFTARRLSISNSELVGTDVAGITHLQSEKNYDPLILENQSWMSTNASNLSSSIKKNRPSLETSSLEIPLLRIHGKKKAIGEILRRISLSLAVFSFTILGCCYGIEEGRSLSKKNLLIAVTLCLAVMISYLLGKELKTPWLTFVIFFFPHPILWFASIRKGLKI